MTMTSLAERIRNVPDFPIPGVQFKDITTLLKDGAAFREALSYFVDRYRGTAIDAIVAVESRGFIIGAPLAYELRAGLIPIRKPGKLPAETMQIAYELEYGTNVLEIHRDALRPGQRVVIVDDVLATGGTTAAAAALVEGLGAEIVELSFLIELTFLHGRDRLSRFPLYSLIQF